MKPYINCKRYTQDVAMYIGDIWRPPSLNELTNLGP